jgi:antitoxin PrlF
LETTMELKAKVTSKGQLTIPKEVRRALGVREGDSLLFEVNEDDEQVRVRVERKPVSFADYEGAWREGKGLSLAEVDEYMRELRGYDDP